MILLNQTLIYRSTQPMFFKFCDTTPLPHTTRSYSQLLVLLWLFNFMITQKMKDISPFVQSIKLQFHSNNIWMAFRKHIRISCYFTLKKQKILQKLKPGRHTTSFQRLYDVYTTSLTSCCCCCCCCCW